MRLLQIGMGGWGRNWATEVVPEVPEVKVVGHVDTLSESLAAVVEEGVAPREQCFTTTAEAIRATSPDAVLVTANLLGHVPAARAALEAGLPVLVEKPLAPSMDEARALVELAEERGLTLMVTQNYRFQPAVHAVREVVRSADLGALTSIEVDFRRSSVRRAAPTGHPVLTDPLLGDMSIHHFDLMRAVTGLDADEIYCRTWHPDGYGYGGAPVGAAVITLEDGPVVSYRGSWVSSGPVTAWAGEWRMDFEYGEVWWTSRPDGSEPGVVESVRVRPDGLAERAVPLPELTRTDRAGCLTEFAVSVREDRSPETTVLDDTDVLTWWGHRSHQAVDDRIVDRVQDRVLGGMGLVVLHSGHASKVFTRLMGTSGNLIWRNDGERELVWSVNPHHPIADGVPNPLIIDQQEMYGEPFGIPEPDELVFISGFDGGEVFRSGCVFHRGNGRIFYFSPGDQEYPVYHHPDVQQVLANAVRWAASPRHGTGHRHCPTHPRDWFLSPRPAHAVTQVGPR